MADRYAQAGVNIEAGNEAVRLIAEAVATTHGPEVLAGVGAFGGLFDAKAVARMRAPVLVASTDGVGTKTLVAARLNRWETIGHDLVNHCVNDILVQGARPLFFLDYVASAHLRPSQVAAIVRGMAEACRAVGCALLGGETAEMPGVYREGAVDVVGTVVGIVEREELITGERIAPGDVVVAFPSSGLHTNGYSLARRALEGEDWSAPRPELGGQSIGEALLAPHRCYAEHVNRLRAQAIDVKGLAHITGGGVFDNLPRILPAGVDARLRRGTWPEPPIFALIGRRASVGDGEMFRVFNMGLGMVAVIPAEEVARALEALPQECHVVGEIVAGDGRVHVEGLNTGGTP